LKGRFSGFNAVPDDTLTPLAVVACQNLRNPAKFSEKKELIAIQGHPRSSIVVSIESAHATSYMFDAP